MDRRIPRHRRAEHNFRQQRAAARRQRSDRLAFWALLLGIFFLIVAAASAHAASGGISTPGVGGPAAPSTTQPAATPFGSRILRLGMEGDDVKVLNGIVKSKSYGAGVHLGTIFESSTQGAVKEFQGGAGLPSTGVVDRSTGKALIRSMDRGAATWYGPGFYGNRTACGAVLRETTIGVAHRSLPCGTKVTLAYHGHTLVAPVIDRGPYARGYVFDLTGATAEALGISGSVRLHYAIGETGSDVRGL
jgi:peptidoglycan hydrolase-like protein with peptidoglycan-binding domain